MEVHRYKLDVKRGKSLVTIRPRNVRHFHLIRAESLENNKQNSVHFVCMCKTVGSGKNVIWGEGGGSYENRDHATKFRTD